MAFVAVVGLAGCQQELVDPDAVESDSLNVYATIEDADDTRTSLNDKEVYWSSGDRIAVFMNKTLRKRFDVSSESVGSKEGVFVYDSDYIVTGKSEAISNNVAYYPFSEVTCAVSGSTYTLSNVTLPSTQSYASASFGQGAFPMVAVTADTDDLDFAFRNLCGVLSLQLKGSGTIKSITVKGNSDELLSGKAAVTASYGKNPEILLLPDGGKTVTLDCGETGVALQNDTPTSFYIVLPPVSFDRGFTVTVTDAFGATKEYSTTKKNTILRSGILRMPEKEYDGERVPQEGDYIDEYGINHGQGVEIGGVVWAPVNCGYHATDFKYGKLYQWGRKYGQGYSVDLYDVNGSKVGTYSDAVVPTVVSGPVDLATGQSQANEDNFYKKNSSPYDDWLSPQNDELWNSGTEENPVKTEYDPCPEGWRVPTFAELNELYQNFLSWTSEGGQPGYWFSGASSYTENAPQVFFPATGFRRGYDDCDADYRGSYGYYWSSTSRASSYGAYHLLFYNGGTILGSSYRANGYSVRCVQDDATLIPVENITLSKSTLALSPGTSETLSSTITPSNANHRSAYWWSDDPEVASVDQRGNVTAVSSGTTIVYAMAGMQVETCKVIVNEVTLEPGTYFFDDFTWVSPWADAYGSEDSVADDNPSGKAPNVYNQASHMEYDGVGYANGGAGVKGYPAFLAEFAKRGYEDINASAKTIYTQKYYLKFGKNSHHTGIKLPAMELEGAEATDVVLSFDWSAHMTASGNIDKVQIVVELAGEGVCADSQTKISLPVSPDQENGDFKWQNVKFLLKGVNNATRITIRPTVLDDSDGIIQKRWYIDNIKVAKPKPTVLAAWDLSSEGMASYADTWGGVDPGTYSKDAGDGGLYVAANAGGNGKLTYVQIDKNEIDVDGKARRICSKTGEPYVEGQWVGDSWNLTAEAAIPAGSLVGASFASRASGTGLKYWIVEYLDGDTWKPALPTRNVEINGVSITYNVEHMNTDNFLINFAVSTTADMSVFHIRETCLSNIKARDGEPLEAPNGGTIRIKGDELSPRIVIF